MLNLKTELFTFKSTTSEREKNVLKKNIQANIFKHL